MILSIDIMKLTKDTVNNQPTQAQIQSAVAQVKAANATHVAIAVPLNSNADMLANGNKPSPLTIEQFTQMCCDAIHNAGLSVLFRGTYCECETIYNFKFNKQPASYWIGKIQNYIAANPGFFKDGDVFAPFPEATNVIPGHSFGDIFLAMPNGTNDYANFFIQLHQAATQAFQKLNKQVQTGLSTNNYSEIVSGWIPQALYDDAHTIVMDDYENPTVLDQHIRDVFAKKGGKYPVFQQEWGMDYTPTDPVAEMNAFTAGVKQRFADGVQNGLNYWGGWTGALESIFDDDGKGGYILNAKGQSIAALYGALKPPTQGGSQPPQSPIGAFTAKAQAEIQSDGKGTLTVTLTNITQ